MNSFSRIDQSFPNRCGPALLPELDCVAQLLHQLEWPEERQKAVQQRATLLVESIRARPAEIGLLNQFLAEYGLSQPEGIALMCVAEALLRIPDTATADLLIRDKIGGQDWVRHLGGSNLLFVNASSWGLMLTGKMVSWSPNTLLGGLARLGEPVIRTALKAAMRHLGNCFVLGQKIGEALANARDGEAKGFRHSYDMLGEGARTAADADAYFRNYQEAITAIGTASSGLGPITGPGVSIKLSALHPRYEVAQADRVLAELAPRLLHLARMAKNFQIGLVVDAEEADRLELSLDVIASVLADPELAGWHGFGLAVQAYQKRAGAVIEEVYQLAQHLDRRVMVRLVKGAYWDAEIKRAQDRGLEEYPVYTRKIHTDLSYLALAQKLLGMRDRIYPMFATHNAATAAAIIEMAGGAKAGGPRESFEFQRLQGMGESLHRLLIQDGYASRIYAPVGGHDALLGYLVRRLLENGANSSFVHRIHDPSVAVADVVDDPVRRVLSAPLRRHAKIPLPRDLFQGMRLAGMGMDLADLAVVRPFLKSLPDFWAQGWGAAPVIGGGRQDAVLEAVLDPADQSRRVGYVGVRAEDTIIAAAFDSARAAFADWSLETTEDRAAILRRLADLLEDHRSELVALLMREAGKILPDAISEIREAVDFCRYYASEAVRLGPQILPAIAGEQNVLSLHGRGVFVCISPWNFPLAIFLGQVAAALVMGNSVIAKPAPETPLIAALVVDLAAEAGLPPGVLNLLPGGGEVGDALVRHPAVAGVAFTGSGAAAAQIARRLATKGGPLVPLIAETGGQNAMIADSSCLPEQLVDDVITGAFRSAGQRCSATRVLFVPHSIADKVLDMLRGAMMELVVGDPALLATDVGPVISLRAKGRLEAHIQRMRAGDGRILLEVPLSPTCRAGCFVAPTLIEIESLNRLQEEVFGPILHVIRYEDGKVNAVLEEIHKTGYGLTGGIHSRIGQTIDAVSCQMKVGNLYVNRSMIGAVVGMQPFGGEGLSGTGPKAGGPFYLPRFAAERTISTNLAAAGGNAALLLAEDEL
jgi:RHH-type transcriptional regulator, proline utilization regulon repressor / proline dehydrogenase / delta 1-pyrroline-5-carboxylate dehydrogenase